MRLTLLLAALGLGTRYVAGQRQQQQPWQDFGAMADLVKQPFYDAVARSPSLAKRDGTCGADRHPCEQQQKQQPSFPNPPVRGQSLAPEPLTFPLAKAPTSTRQSAAPTPSTAS